MFAKWRKRRDCMHHDRRRGYSWVLERLINTGSGKMFWCKNCGKTWFV